MLILRFLVEWAPHLLNFPGDLEREYIDYSSTECADSDDTFTGLTTGCIGIYKDTLLASDANGDLRVFNIKTGEN